MELSNLFVSQPSNKKFVPLQNFFTLIIKTIILIFFRKKNYDVGDEHSLYLVVKFEANSLIISCLNKATMTSEAGLNSFHWSLSGLKIELVFVCRPLF